MESFKMPRYTKNAKTAKKNDIYIDRQMALKLGTKFYISQNACRNCGGYPSVRFTSNSCCIQCSRKRGKN